jgi:hypothetical protein
MDFSASRPGCMAVTRRIPERLYGKTMSVKALDVQSGRELKSKPASFRHTPALILTRLTLSE